MQFRGGPGTLCVLRGENGSGKTTMLRTLAGLLPHTGQVRYEGGTARGTTLAPNGAGFHERRTVRDHIRLLIRSRLVQRADVEDMVDLLGLGPLLGQVPARMSLGERQSVALLGPLASRPGLLLVDEPFVGLDASRWDAVAERLDDLLRAGTTMVATSHGADWIGQRAARAVVLSNGHVASDVDGPGLAVALRHVELDVPEPDAVAASLAARGHSAWVADDRPAPVVMVATDRVDPVVAAVTAAGLDLRAARLVSSTTMASSGACPHDMPRSLDVDAR